METKKSASRARLDRLDEALAPLGEDATRTLVHVLVGALSHHTDDEVWDSCLATATEVAGEIGVYR